MPGAHDISRNFIPATGNSKPAFQIFAAEKYFFLQFGDDRIDGPVEVYQPTKFSG
jgi:hypothetical protein